MSTTHPRPSIEDLVTGRHVWRAGLARVVRLDAGLSQVDVADECGVTQPAVSQWERGDRRPSGEAGRRYVALLARLARGDLSTTAGR